MPTDIEIENLIEVDPWAGEVAKPPAETKEMMYVQRKFSEQVAAQREILSKPVSCSQDAILLDGRRGFIAHWFNSVTSTPGGLIPGCKLLIGGSSGGGKTTILGLIAADAVMAGCRVLMVQLELEGAETTPYILGQVIGNSSVDELRKMNSRDRFFRDFKDLDKWDELITICDMPGDQMASVDKILGEMVALVELSNNERKAGRYHHKVNLLVCLDYAQLLKCDDTGMLQRHDILVTAVAKLAKATAELGCVLILLSQLTKEAVKNAGLNQAIFMGASINQSASTAIAVCPATIDKTGTWNPAEGADTEQNLAGYGRPAVAKLIKSRGLCPGQLFPEMVPVADEQNPGKFICKATQIRQVPSRCRFWVSEQFIHGCMPPRKDILDMVDASKAATADEQDIYDYKGQSAVQPVRPARMVGKNRRKSMDEIVIDEAANNRDIEALERTMARQFANKKNQTDAVKPRKPF